MGLLAKFIEPENKLVDPPGSPDPPTAPTLADTCPVCGSAILWASVYDPDTRLCVACTSPPSERMIRTRYFDGEAAATRRRRLRGTDDQLRWQFGGIDPWADYVWERYYEAEVDGWSVLLPIRIL